MLLKWTFVVTTEHVQTLASLTKKENLLSDDSLLSGDSVCHVDSICAETTNERAIEKSGERRGCQCGTGPGCCLTVLLTLHCLPGSIWHKQKQKEGQDFLTVECLTFSRFLQNDS